MKKLPHEFDNSRFDLPQILRCTHILFTINALSAGTFQNSAYDDVAADTVSVKFLRATVVDN
jgi:hypothetical protein